MTATGDETNRDISSEESGIVIFSTINRCKPIGNLHTFSVFGGWVRFGLSLTFDFKIILTLH